MVDIEKYEFIVEKYTRPLFQYCYYRLDENSALTEETMDDIMHLLYQKWESLDVDGNIRAWLYRVADNTIKYNKKKYNKYYKHTISLEEAIDDNKLDHLQYCDDYFNDYDINEDEYLDKIKNVLPDEYKNIFVYRYIEKKTLVETSKLTGIPYSSLRLRIDKLEKTIKEEVKKIFY